MGYKQRQASGFTIIELLIVIVVIGILAAITIVAYTGITNHARLATLQSDLSGAGTQLSIDNVNNGAYPATTADANNGAGLKASSGTTYQYTYTSATNSYCLTGTNNAISYYISNTDSAPQAGACPGDVNGGGGGGGGGAITDGSLIQTITSSNCPSTRTRAVDARDNHTYWVQELADGECWMLTNLAYAGGGTNTYSDTKILINGTSDSDATYTTGKYYIPTGANPTTEPTLPSTSTNGTGQYGYLYNWCGAMGDQATAACADVATPAPDTSISVCPAGWELPIGDDTTGGFGILNNTINGGTNTFIGPLSTIWLAQMGGEWASGSFIHQGTPGGGYWSSAPFAAIPIYADFLNLADLNENNVAQKYVGLAVRCVAD